MIELSNIHLSLKQANGIHSQELRACRSLAMRLLHIAPHDLSELEIYRRSIDARKRNKVQVVFTLRLALQGGEPAELKVLDRINKGNKRTLKGVRVRLVQDSSYMWPTLHMQPDQRTWSRPIVVGAGCAGLFCALALAEAGLCPLLIERGDDASRRTHQVQSFIQTGSLDVESNIQFGLGGAGTFSDGKLATGTKSPAHRLILQSFVDAGAAPDILWDAHPHIGSDILPQVVTTIAQRIEELGGEIRTRCKLICITTAGSGTHRKVQSVQLIATRDDGSTYEETVPARDVVLSCGHSARDVYELLRDADIMLERKTFAMGVRIEHLQSAIDQALYGASSGNPALGPAPYKLVCHLPKQLPSVGGRSAFSFCMCPGGYVVAAASEEAGVVTNGMSLAARDGCNANAGLLVNVTPQDLQGTDVFAGIELQRSCERAAFMAGGGHYVAPAQLVGDFLERRASTGPGSVHPTYSRGVSWGALDACLPAFIIDTLREAIPRMARTLSGFDAADAVLTGVETRSSSPVRVSRDESLQSYSCRGLWPAGEGAGYAGGIMSAATDGIRVAEALISQRFV